MTKDSPLLELNLWNGITALDYSGLVGGAMSDGSQVITVWVTDEAGNPVEELKRNTDYTVVYESVLNLSTRPRQPE